jgi:hypothetical protein
MGGSHDSSYTRYSSLLLPHHLLLLIGLSCLSAVEAIYCVLFEEANCFFAVVFFGSRPQPPKADTAGYIDNQREGMGLLEYQDMPSVRDVAHDGVLYTFSDRSALDRGK